MRAFKSIVFGDLAAGGKRTAECGDALDVAPELDFFGEEGVAGLAILGALVGEVGLVLYGEFCCRDEKDIVGHSVLL